MITQFLRTRRRAVGTGNPLLGPLLLLAGICTAQPLQAACLASANPEIRALDVMVEKDAAKALAEAQARLGGEARRPHPDSRRMAELYVVQAAAYSALELDTKAREAAANGLDLVPDQSDPAHLELLSWYSVNFYDEAGVKRAIVAIEAARASQRPGSVADICLLTTLGRLQHQMDRPDLAVVSLTQAYRASLKPELAKQRVLAASALSPVMRSAGDFTQALALNQEVIDWDTERQASFDLSVARYMRGKILSAQGNYAVASGEFKKAHELSVLLDDQQGIGFADMSGCEAEVELAQFATARNLCDSAERVFSKSKSTDVQKQTLALLARIDLGEGQPGWALVALNRVLDHDGADLIPRQIAFVYQLRARARAALHDYDGAYADLDEYARRFAAENDFERNRQSAVLRARFDTDREIERNTALQRELAFSREHSARAKEELRWTVVIIAAGALLVAMLSYILFATLRHRRELLRLASEDSLTGLPNRRLVAELATAALNTSTVMQSPLTIALIDLDHFKDVNDRFGHAVGDEVLKEFAKVSRDALRDSDFMGRWGGEEFLLVMPDTALDTAVVVIDRLRALSLAIALPVASPPLRVSFSSGLATRAESTQKLEELVARADTALYEAKNEGRDLTRIAKESYRAASTGVRRALAGAQVYES